MKKVDIVGRKNDKAKEVVDGILDDLSDDQKVIVVYTSKDGTITSRSANMNIAESIAFLELCKMSFIVEITGE